MTEQLCLLFFLILVANPVRCFVVLLAVIRYKCTKHTFIHLLMAAFKDLLIENSKNYKRWYSRITRLVAWRSW